MGAGAESFAREATCAAPLCEVLTCLGPHHAQKDRVTWEVSRLAVPVLSRRSQETEGKTPRVVPGFRSPFLLGVPLSMTPGSSIIASPDFDADIAFAEF
jgi:hypothetical protein